LKILIQNFFKLIISLYTLLNSLSKKENLWIFLFNISPLKKDFKKIILACDNQTSATYNLIGKGNMAELAIFGIDDYVIEKNLSKED
jgi:hypothetical protein